MSSKLETSSASNLLSNKINKMLTDLNKDFANFDSTTEEDVIISFNEVVKKFYDTIGKPLFSYKPFREGKLPNIEEMNASFIASQQDMEIIYEELSSIRRKLASNFNTLTGAAYKVKSNLAKASSDLLDYKIQNTNRIEPMFYDKFNNLDKVESEDGLYDKDKCFIDSNNNRVLSSLDGEAETLKIKRIRIAEDSIGNSGNNEEIGAVARDNLQFISDNNMDSWFEFEQVSRNEILTPTILSLKLEFDEEKIFNMLEVAPLSLPNGTYPAISAIRGSIDGSVFFDLMPMYQGEIADDSIGNKVIQLNPDSENPSDENILYFFPKKIKFLSIKFIEDSSYFIRTPSGVKNRIAVAIKELKAKAQKFKPEAQFITTTHISNKEISKVAIKTSERLPPNFNSTMDYFISADSGRTWDEISPSQKVSEKPEVLNYNIDFLEGSKRTEVPVQGLKLKLNMKIETSADDASINSAFRRIEKTEFQSIGAGSKVINLQEKPIGTLGIYQVNYGSIGRGNFYRVPSANITELDDRFLVQLPLNVFPGQRIAKDQEILFIDNFVWERKDSLNTSLASDLHYEFDYINNIITFHKDLAGDRKGKKPAGEILFKLKREGVLFRKLGDSALVETVFQHDGIKEKINIYKLKEEVLNKVVRIRNRSSVHRLAVQEIQTVSIVKDLNNKMLSQKDYINGVLELTSTGDYSVDKDKGILYTQSPVDSDEDIQVSIDYKEREEVPFSIANGDITIKSNLYKTENKTFDLDIASPTYVIDLGILNIEKGSIQFVSLPTEIGTEVKFEEMEEKFEDIDIINPYAIDYRNGVLYTKNPLSGNLKGILSAADYYIEYNISYKIPVSAYLVDEEEQIVTFNDDYVLDYFADSQKSGLSSPLFKIEYGYAEDVTESSTEILQYVTPVLSSYTIIATPKDVVV